MKAACEVCGSPLRASPNRVEIDGAVMVVCNNCAKLGKPLGASRPGQTGDGGSLQEQHSGFKVRGLAPRPAPIALTIESDFEVDPDYYLKVRQAREKMGLSQEQLGSRLNEKPSVIRMVESKKLKPDVTLTRKLMHELKINLLISRLRTRRWQDRPLNPNRALLVTHPDRDTIEEAESLARAAGYEPIGLVTQGFLQHAKYGVGSGKAEELARLAQEKEADLIVFDSALRASQAYSLAKLCKVEVKDREKVILEIFAMRASTAEAKLQVQLAELEYELPRARESVKMARQGEQPGFFGLGKYEADVYTRMMKSRISTLKRKVEAVDKRREIFREHRRKLAFPTIALAGYTAAGKTSLFNRLTGESKSVDAGVFTTLAPTTRAIMIGDRKTLLTDTVGFISNLPTYLIESFKSTLEEISYASIVFLLLDVSQSARSS